MIGYLKGSILRIESNYLILDVNGVGYKVLAPTSTLSKHRINDIINLEIYTHVKEDQLSLFGFETLEDLKMFEMLLDVSGVGPKTALAVLTALNSQQIITIIQKAKVDEFTKLPGIGKKVAQKIIVELQSKIGKVSELNLEEQIIENELVESLLNMGFSQAEAVKMSKGVDENLTLQEKIKLSLKKADGRK